MKSVAKPSRVPDTDDKPADMDASAERDTGSVLPLPTALEYGVAGSEELPDHGVAGSGQLPDHGVAGSGQLPDRSVVFDNEAFDKEEKGSDSGLETVSKL